jgi:hypothetical protein
VFSTVGWKAIAAHAVSKEDGAIREKKSQQGTRDDQRGNAFNRRDES